jgi:hypothetical protein
MFYLGFTIFGTVRGDSGTYEIADAECCAEQARLALIADKTIIS